MKYTVKVKLKASREGVRQTDPFTLQVAVREPPEKGRANAAVIRLVAGHASRSKIVGVDCSR